eukprot:31479-Pelagococcus_subviridis.AAC.35
MHPTLKKYPDEILEAQDEVTLKAGENFDCIALVQQRARRRHQLRAKVERVVWILTSFCIIYYGDGSVDLVTASTSQSGVLWSWYVLAFLPLGINMWIMCHLVRRHQLQHRGSNWSRKAPWALPASSICGRPSKKVELLSETDIYS